MNYRKQRDILGALFWWFALIFTIGFWWAFGMVIYSAFAHEARPTAAQPNGWRYDWECCSSLDCAEVPAHHVTEGPDGVTITLDKGDHPMILWPASITIPYGDKRIRISKDGEYHVCHDRQFIRPDGTQYTGKFLCVYIPPRGA